MVETTVQTTLRRRRRSKRRVASSPVELAWGVTGVATGAATGTRAADTAAGEEIGPGASTSLAARHWGQPWHHKRHSRVIRPWANHC